MTEASRLSTVKRVRRVEGRIRALIGMIESGRDCLEVAQQLHAVENALENFKRELIHDHINHCTENALTKGAMSAGDVVGQMRSLTKYL